MRPDQRVLLHVEPRKSVRAARSAALRSVGYDVIEAPNAAAAVEAAAGTSLSAAVVHVDLPDASALDLCSTLKRIRGGLPVLLLSPRTPSREEEAAWLALADGCVNDDEQATLEETLDAAVACAAEWESPRCWLISDLSGSILELSADAAAALNGTTRGLEGRSLITFFEQGRDEWRRAMVRASLGERVVLSGRLRPRERRPLVVSVAITKAGTAALRWDVTVLA